MKKLSALEPTQRRAALKPGKPEIRQNYYPVPVPIFSSSWSLPFNCKSSQSINNPDRTHSLGNHGGGLVVGSHGEGLGVLGRKHLGRVMLKKIMDKKTWRYCGSGSGRISNLWPDTKLFLLPHFITFLYFCLLSFYNDFRLQ